MHGPLKWHGGQHYLAKRIVGLMPPHTHYVEPFAGGLAVLLAKDPEGVSEVVNDLDGGLATLWRVLRGDDTFPRFARHVEATPFSEADWRDAESLLGNPDPVTRAAAIFVLCRQSLAGRMESFTPLSRTRTRRGMSEQASAWLTAVEGLPAVHTRLKRVVILNRDALDVIRTQDGPDTLFYLDPPYRHTTRATTDDYSHEMTDTQHLDLLGRLSRVVGKVVLSGYRCDMYDAAAERHGWRRVDIDMANHAAGGVAKRRMTECLWMNYPEATAC